MGNHYEINSSLKTCGKLARWAIHLPLITISYVLANVATADTLCVPNFRFTPRDTRIVSDGVSCPRGTKSAGSIVSKSEVERLIADALSDRTEIPSSFFLSAQAGAPVCQGIDVKSRCADQDGCRLRYRIVVKDEQRSVWNEVRIAYNSVTRLITISNDGFQQSVALGFGNHSILLYLAGGESFIATDKPTDGCVDTTNFIDDGFDSIWLRTTSRFQLDGALLD